MRLLLSRQGVYFLVFNDLTVRTVPIFSLRVVFVIEAITPKINQPVVIWTKMYGKMRVVVTLCLAIIFKPFIKLWTTKKHKKGLLFYKTMEDILSLVSILIYDFTTLLWF